jgi:poly(3-hydroxybutyrate) depolymerase
VNRHNLLVAAFIPLLAAAGFTQTLSFKVAGVTRNSIIHVPSGLSKPPLVFILHGLGGDGAGMQSSTQMDKVADREKFIVTYPSAISGTWDYAAAKPNDYTFFMAIIDTLDARYNIDRNRVYIAGFSQGGGETVYAGFKYPDVFAAIAPVSSIGKGAALPNRPIPILLTFGTKDIYSQTEFMSAVSSWLKVDSCPATAVITRPYPSSNSQSTVTRLEYKPCAQGTEIVVDSISGGTHEWPMNATTKVNNSEEVWAFFKKFSLKGNTAVQRQTFPVSHNCVSVSYCSGIVRIQGAEEKSRVRVIDTEGRLVSSATITKNQFAFKDKPSGVYVIIMSGKEHLSSTRMVIP